ncbi:hypothetical protein BDV19DRAFT_175616 [Aspergillus venezuelensis]
MSESSCSDTPSGIPAVGLSEVSKPSSDRQTVADIVFVHGLGGHPKRTWTYPPASSQEFPDIGSEGIIHSSRLITFKRPLGWLRKSSNGQSNVAPGVDDNHSSGRCFWPADLLALDFPDVRVLTYGYESQVARFFSTLNLSTITQHSQDLLSRLTSERHESPERPLIFIAHSLGGLLVKGALNESALHQPDDPQRRISRECRMVMFFGTPHRGSDFAQWGSALANIASVLGFSVNTRIVQNLARESEILQRLERDFEGIIAQRDTLGRKFKIYTFQEAKAVGGPLNKQV